MYFWNICELVYTATFCSRKIPRYCHILKISNGRTFHWLTNATDLTIYGRVFIIAHIARSFSLQAKAYILTMRLCGNAFILLVDGVTTCSEEYYAGHDLYIACWRCFLVVVVAVTCRCIVLLNMRSAYRVRRHYNIVFVFVCFRQVNLLRSHSIPLNTQCCGAPRFRNFRKYANVTFKTIHWHFTASVTLCVPYRPSKMTRRYASLCILTTKKSDQTRTVARRHDLLSHVRWKQDCHLLQHSKLLVLKVFLCLSTTKSR